MKRNQRDLVRISDEAAYWVIRLAHDESAQTQAEFDRWLRQGAQRFDEFWKANLAWTSLNQLDEGHQLGSPESEDRVVPFPVSRTGEDVDQELSFAQADTPTAKARSSRRTPVWGLGLAAAIVLAIGAITLIPNLPFGSEVYATALGSQQAIKLSDGSIIRLNTHSRVKVRYSEHLREIRLSDGEAFFTVAHDTSRPFVVITDSARIRAVGTEFNVYRAEAGATRVSVLDGVVQVTTAENKTNELLPANPQGEAALSSDQRSSAVPTATAGTSAVVRLSAGDEAVVRQGQIARAPSPDVKRAVAWQERQLVFTSDRIDYIAEQFNRYNTVKIRVEGSVAERRMGGTFDVDDPMPMVRYLSRDPNVEVIKDDTQILIRPRDAAETRN